MPKYIVCYEIPAELEEESINLQESRSADYAPLYEILDKMGSRLITSTYIIDFDDNSAAQVRLDIMYKLPDDIRERIEMFVFELPENKSYNL